MSAVPGRRGSEFVAQFVSLFFSFVDSLSKLCRVAGLLFLLPYHFFAFFHVPTTSSTFHTATTVADSKGRDVPISDAKVRSLSAALEAERRRSELTAQRLTVTLARNAQRAVALIGKDAQISELRAANAGAMAKLRIKDKEHQSQIVSELRCELEAARAEGERQAGEMSVLRAQIAAMRAEVISVYSTAAEVLQLGDKMKRGVAPHSKLREELHAVKRIATDVVRVGEEEVGKIGHLQRELQKVKSELSAARAETQRLRRQLINGSPSRGGGPRFRLTTRPRRGPLGRVSPHRLQ
eukprot:Hpha_TRINITY_DN17909_c0_g1::TRINITY_DN17909_c0_g1_i1::g.33766::m.33766